MQYTDRGKASQADRDFSECPLAEGSNGLYCTGSSYNEGGHIWNGNGEKGLTVNAKGEDTPVSLINDSGVTGRGGDYHRYGNADAYNYSPASYSLHANGAFKPYWYRDIRII